METEPNGLDLVTQRWWEPSNPESSKRRRKKQRWNPGADFDQTQAAKASGDAKRRDQTCLVAATMQKTQQPRRRSNQTQAAKASGDAKRRDRTCLATVTMQKSSNPSADLTKPSRWKLQAMRRFLWRVGLICFGFDLFMGFWGLEVESGTAFGEKKERKNKKKKLVEVWAKLKSSALSSISINIKRVLWARFPWR